MVLIQPPSLPLLQAFTGVPALPLGPRHAVDKLLDEVDQEEAGADDDLSQGLLSVTGEALPHLEIKYLLESG